MVDKPSISLTEIESIINKYKSGMHQHDIGKEFGRSRYFIRKILIENGVNLRSKSEAARQYSLNEHIFDVIDTQKKAYFLGLLYADGCNYTKRGTIHLQLSEKDIQILYDFYAFLETKRPLWIQDRRNDVGRMINGRVVNYTGKMCTASVSSRHMSDRLTELGCISNKSLSLKFPEWIQKDLVAHFLRGYFDGDGSLSISGNGEYSATFEIVGTESFCSSVKEILKTELGVHSWISNKNDNRISSLSSSGNIQVLKLMEWLYTDCTVKLERKYNNYLKLKERFQKFHIDPKPDGYRGALPGDIKAKILFEYKDGAKTIELAEKYHVGRISVQRIINKAGILRGKKHPLTDDIKRGVISDYIAGMTRIDISEKYNIGTTSVELILKESNTPLRRGTRAPIPEDIKQRAVSEYLAGVGPGEIARKYGFDRHTIYNFLEKTGSPRHRVKKEIIGD